MKRLTILVLIAGLIALLYGCCSHGSNSGVFVNISGNSETVYREVVIDEKGRLPRVSFPSGTIIKAEEEMTLQPGIRVVLAEQKLTSEKSSVFSDSLNTSIYIYKITATMKSDDPLVADTVVTTTEKPFTVTIPNSKSNTGILYLGVSEDDTSPWRFFQKPEDNENTVNSSSLRSSKDIPQLQCTFNLYRLGTRFAIWTYDGKKEKIPETSVNSLTASAPAQIPVKGGKYIKDLTLKGLMKGHKLDSFKPSDFIARITYRNNSEKVAQIKVNGAICQQTTAKDKTVPGKSFVHSFTVSNITETDLMNQEGEFSFTLNIKGIETELFPSDFLIEFYNKIEGETIHPYSYTEFLTLKQSENVTMTINPDSKNQLSSDNPLYRCNPSFTITSDHAFSDSDKAKIASAVRIIKFNPSISSNAVTSVSAHEVSSPLSQQTDNSSTIRGATSEEDTQIEYVTEGVNKEWQDNKLKVSFSKNLDGETSYEIALSETNDIEGVTIVPFDNFTFKTVGDAVFSIAPNEGSIVDAASQTYSLQPTFYITTNYEGFSGNDWSQIADSISVSNLDKNIASKTISNNSIVLSFVEELATDTEYLISMNENNGLDGINSVPFDNFKFITQGITTINASFTIASDEGNVLDNTNSLYRLNPSFTITSDYEDFSDSDKEKIAKSIIVSNGGSDIASLTWKNNRLRLSFNTNLATATTFTISMEEINDIECVAIQTFEPFSFTTNEGTSLTITHSDTNIFDTNSGRYQCRPTFVFETSDNFTDEEKAIIGDSIILTNIASSSIIKSWENDTLSISLTENLATNTTYTLSMNDIKSIEGIFIKGFEPISFTTIDDISFTVTPDEDNVYTAMSPKYHCKPGFTITPNYPLNDENKAKISNAVSVTNSSNITKEWDGNELKIGFSSNLAPDTDYTLSMAAVNDISGVTVNSFNTIDFSTIATLTFTLTPDADNVFIAGPPELYHCRPLFTLTPSFTLNEEDKATIANAISLNNDSNNKLTKTWNNNELTISCNSNLSHSTEYTLFMEAVNNIKGVVVNPFDSIAFTTIDGLNVTLSSDDGNVFATVEGNDFYQTLPTFTVTTNLILSAEDRTKITNAISVSNVASNKITKSWSNDTTLNISFTENLSLNASFTISMAEVDDISGISVSSFNDFAFSTMKALTFTVTPDDSNVYTAMSPKYHCKPAFTISPNYPLSALTAASKTVLLNAVAVSDSSGLTKDWDGDNIRLTFSSNQSSGNHSISMAAVNGFTNITVTPFADYNFTILDSLTFTVTPDAGNVYTALSPKNHCRPSFTITPSFTLNEGDRTYIANAVSVSGVSSSNLNKSWSENNLVVSFNQNLTSNTAYTMSMGAVSGMDNVNITGFSDQTFTTIPQLTFGITSANTNVFYDSKYHCNPTFTITPSFTINSGDKSAIENAISVSGVSSNNLSKTWNGNNMLLGFNQYIATSTDFTISMSAIDSLTGVNVISLSNYEFSTIPDLIVSIATTSQTIVRKSSASGNLDINGKNYCYCSGLGFNISTNMTLNSANKAKIYDAISLTGIDSSLVNKGWNGEKIAISFNSDLTASTSYAVIMSSINDINGVTVKTFSPYNFITFFHEGKGTQADPFTIYTPIQLDCLHLYAYEPYYYKQMEDLNLSGYANWEPIGSRSTYLQFRGRYDGNNKTISNVTINYPEENTIGLFSTISATTISNLTLENFTVHGHNDVGALTGVAVATSKFINITANNISVTGNQNVGGVWGDSNGSKISNCEFSNIEVNASDVWIGIIIGVIRNSGTISDCNVSNSFVRGRSYVGGFVGESYGNTSFTNIICDNVTVTGTGSSSSDEGLGGFGGNCARSEKENCSVINSHILGAGLTNKCGGMFGRLGAGTKDITRNCVVRNTEITSKGISGGFVADYYVSDDSSNLISDCLVENTTVSGSNYTGGFVGKNDNSNGSGIQNTNVASITISSTGSNVGGFAGEFKCNLNSCYVENAKIQADGNQIGGLVGTTTSNITSCYVASISMNTSGNYIGGLVGYSNGGNITSCYSDKADILGRMHSVGGLVGIQTSTGNIENCHVTKSNVRFATVDNMQCYGGLVGQSAGTVSKCYVDQSSVSALQQVGGIVGYFTGGSITKSFIINSNIRAQDVSVGGICGEMYAGTQIDSCYVKGCNIAFTDEELSDRIGGFAATCKSSITNSYTYNTTITGRTGYGALAGVSEENGSISNCFISDNYSTLIKDNSNSNPLTNCYYNVNNLSTFNTGPWSDGAWSNFNTTSFPPKLTEVAEP